MAESKLNIENYDFDDELIELARDDRTPQLKIYTIDRQIVVIGRGGKPDVELQLGNIISDGVPVYRRSGGGCSVVLDPGNIIISVVLPVRGFTENRYYFNLLSDWLKEGLINAGFSEVETGGISDLMIDGRKISGSCIYNALDYLYYSTTILVHPDTKAMERYLKHPPREPEYRRGRRHSDFVTGLDEHYRIAEVDKIVTSLREHLDPGKLRFKN